MLVLTLNHREIRLGEGAHVIGRAPDVGIVLSDTLASRKHARLVVDETGATVEDLSSANGVWVNGARISGSHRLAPADVVLIGQTELVVSGAPGARPRADVRTVDERPSVRAAAAPAYGQAVDDEPVTGNWDLLATLTTAADEAIRRGRATDAATLVEEPLQQMLADLRRGRRLQPGSVDRASLLAIKLGAALAAPKWLDLVIAFHAVEVHLMALPVLAALKHAMPKAPGLDPVPFRAYVAELRARSLAMSSSQRLLVHELEELCA